MRRPSSTWYARQKRRRESPFFRLLDRSFGFRVLMAAVLSFALLAVVNRFENCHAKAGQSHCLTSNFLEIISIGTVESFSIVTAAIFYLLEAGQRKEKEHQEMFELLLAQRQAGAANTLGRLRALEMLSADGLWQDDFDLGGVDLEGLRIPFSRWRRANFSGTVLRNADCHGADLAEADFSRADLSGANFRGADLRAANFTGADLSRTDLRGARVDGAEFRGAQLSRTLTDGPLPGQEAAAGAEEG
ncbi:MULTISPECIES: pentapeptide repeat-containing protein [unclassified Synechococcus]|uniref:pentapeptide repeat-containing protein n=1 Tax=unclassified Synechococcus TaxID=2626047 RepID=UPI001C20F87A|nr:MULTISPECIES: pentapeptide repeat-containing protein [unclassified Synechococcus]